MERLAKCSLYITASEPADGHLELGLCAGRDGLDAACMAIAALGSQAVDRVVVEPRGGTGLSVDIQRATRKRSRGTLTRDQSCWRLTLSDGALKAWQVYLFRYWYDGVAEVHAIDTEMDNNNNWSVALAAEDVAPAGEPGTMAREIMDMLGQSSARDARDARRKRAGARRR